jgi:hypothetical protein
VALTNHGTIIGGNGGSTGASGGAGAGLVNVTVNNYGTIQGGAGVQTGAGGIGAYDSNQTFTDQGTIIGGAGGSGGQNGGAGGTGLQTSSTAVTISGSVSGGAGGSGALTGGAGGIGVHLVAGSLSVSGTISGGAGGASPATAGTQGDAVLFGTYAATLTANVGAVFNGNVVADAAVADALVLAGSGNGALAGLGTQFTGFSAIDFSSGSDWAISGNAAALASGQTIANFALGDTITLTGFAATTETYVAGTGVKLSNGSVTETLLLTNVGTVGSFAFTTTGGSTVISLQTQLATITTLVSNSVTIGSALYGSPLTVTSTGSVVPATAGAAAVQGTGASPTLINAGLIQGGQGAAASTGGDGVVLTNGTITNTGSIAGGAGGSGAAGGIGVMLSGGTLTTSGAISGGAGSSQGDAVLFGAGAAGTLILDPGASFSGNVVASPTAPDTLVLAGTGTGGLAGLGTQVIGFSSIDFTSGATWAISGTSAALATGQTIANFAAGDSITLTNFFATSETFVAGTGLELGNGSATETLALTNVGTSGTLAVSSINGSTSIALATGATTYVLQPGANMIHGANSGDIFQATAASIDASDSLTGGTGANLLQLSGGGVFDLRTPSVFASIPTIDATEGQVGTLGAASTNGTVYLRNGVNETLNVAAGTKAAGNTSALLINITSSNATNTINLASGTDKVVLGQGTDTITLGGTANSVKAGGGTAHILSVVADASASIVGTTTGSTLLEITNAGTVKLNAADTHLTVLLDGATRLTLDKLGFITANGGNGGDTIIGGAANQTLIGGAKDALTGYASGGDTFTGSSSALNGDVLANWTTGDVLDLTNVNSATLLPLTYASGKLTVSDGTDKSVFTVKGTTGVTLTLASFTVVGNDGHGGTLIDWHG